MKGTQLWVTAPYEVALERFDLPEAPAAGHVLLQTEQTLISAGTELAIVTGTHIGFSKGARWPRYPMALGYTAVGRVLAVGGGVENLALGDRVVSDTAHASHAVVDMAARRLQRVPEGCSAAGALLAHLSATPLHGVRLARPQLGEGMIVFGQGLIGAFAARFGRLMGCRPVLGVDPLAGRRDIAAAAGIRPVDPATADPVSLHREMADGRLPEIVIEATGSPDAIPAALQAAAVMGRVVLLGSPRGRIEIDPYTDLHRKGITVIGGHMSFAPEVATPYNPFTHERNRHMAMEMFADGTLPVDGLVSHHIRPEEARETYRALAERAHGYMGVVIDWGGFSRT